MKPQSRRCMPSRYESPRRKLTGCGMRFWGRLRAGRVLDRPHGAPEFLKEVTYVACQHDRRVLSPSPSCSKTLRSLALRFGTGFACKSGMGQEELQK